MSNSIDIELEKLAQLQEELAKKVILPAPEQEMYLPQQNDILLTLDIQYVEEKAFVAGDWQYLNGQHITTQVDICKVGLAYFPAYFCFREGPPLLEFLQKAIQAGLPTPNVIIVDGHGQAHPRKFGVASWLGVYSDLPCVGCAKDTLVWYQKELLSNEKNSIVPIKLPNETEIIGYALRSQTNVKPIFVSNAHKISLAQSLTIIQNVIGEYRIPLPLRRADFACRRASQTGKSDKEWKFLFD